MSKDTTEEVIARDVYEVGMTVRLRSGGNEVIGEVDDERPDQPYYTTHNEGNGGYWYYADGRVNTGTESLDIIGEVVTAPKAVVATKPKRAAVTSTRTEERVYSDGIVTHNGKVDGMTMDEARKERRYIDRCIDRLKRDGEYYGWEV